LNEIVGMTMDALSLVMEVNGGDMDESETEQANLLKSEMVKFGELEKDIQKAGAKISAGRLSALKDIASKLNALIRSVASQSAEEKGCAGGAGGKKGGKTTKKALTQDIETLKSQFVEVQKAMEGKGEGQQVAEIKKQLEEAVSKVSALANRLSDLEKGAGASTSIEDDESTNQPSGNSTSKSVFSGFGPLADVTKRIEKTQRVSAVRRK